MSRAPTPAYEYHHVVTYSDTNAVGNVYFASYFRWQGLVRETFLHEHAPEVLSRVDELHPLVTMDSSCVFLNELWAFDTLVIRMYADAPVQNRVRLRFEYWRVNPDPPGDELVARGEQMVAWLERDGRDSPPRPIPVPVDLIDAIAKAQADRAAAEALAKPSGPH